MKKTIFVLILILLILPVSTFAVTYNAWNYDSDTIKFNDEYFTLQVTRHAVRVFGETENFILFYTEPDEACFRAGTTKFCVENITHDIERDEYKARIDLSEKEADLKITRKLQDKKIILGTKHEVVVTITNNGNAPARNIYYQETYPEQKIRLVDCDSCQLVSNQVIYQTSGLDAGETTVFDYKFVALRGEEDTYAAKINYEIYDEVEELYTSSLLISPLQPFNTKFTYSDDEGKIGETTRLTLNISNDYDERLDIYDVLIYAPTHLQIETIGGKVLPSGKVTLLDGFVLNNADGYKKFVFEITPMSDEPAEVLFDFYYLRNDEELQNLGVKTTYEIEEHEINVMASLEENEEVDEQTPHDFYIRIINPNENIKLNNIELVVEAPLLFDTKQVSYLDELSEGLSTKMFSKTVWFPKAEEGVIKTNYSYNITYVDEYAKTRSLYKVVPFKIKPLSGVEIRKSGCSKTLKFNEECEMTITVKNNLKGDLENVFIREVYNTNKVSRRGEGFAKKDIDAAETLTAYKYTLSYPQRLEDFQKSINATTLVTYYYNNIRYDESKTNVVSFESYAQQNRTYDLKLSTVFDAKTFYEGTIYPVTYTIVNNDEEILRNLKIIPGKHQYLDVIDNDEVVIEEIKPGEKKTATMFFRSKKNDTYTFQASLVFFDEYGFEHETSFSDKKILFLNNNFVGPIIIMETSTPLEKEYFLGDIVKVTTKISNKGSDQANLIILSMNGTKHSANLISGESATLNDEVLVDNYNNITLLRIKAYYNYGRRIYYAASNQEVLEVHTPKKQEQEKEEILEEEILEEDVVIDDEKEGAEGEEGVSEDLNKPGLISRVIQRIKNFFDMLNVFNREVG